MTLAKPAVRFSLSIFAALIAALLTSRAIANARRESGLGPSARVAVMRKAVPAGRPVPVEAVELKSIPAAYAEPGAFADVKEVVGARARISLSPGEQLTRAKIENAGSRLGLAWTLPPGSRALTLRLPVEGAVGGHVLPGDWVSVLAGSREATSSLVGRARVVAVQERLWDSTGAPPSPQTTLVNDAILVTLMVTSDQALRIATAAERGRLTLTLLSPLDDAPAGGGRHAG